MPDVSFTALLLIMVVAVAAPLLVGYLPGLRIPSVVVEIIAGVVLGPSVLGWVHRDLTVQVLAILGLAFLLFLAGLEIDLDRLRGKVLRLALAGYVVSLALGLTLGELSAGGGWTVSPVLVAVALSATSLGLVVPVLKDAGKADGTLGQTTIAAATVADFAAIVLLTLFFSASDRSLSSKALLFAIFAGLVGVLALVVTRAGRSMHLGAILVRLQDTTAELRVRFAVLLLIGFVALASTFGLETILGAFLAGAVVALVDRDSRSHPHFRAKLDAVGYGFLVPIFFVSSGVQLDLLGLFSEPTSLLRVPVLLLALLIVRGVPAVLYRNTVSRREMLAAGLLQATSLPFIVTASSIGVALGYLTPITAAALVSAGLLSVLLFPAAALSILHGGTSIARKTRVTNRTLAGLNENNLDSPKEREMSNENTTPGFVYLQSNESDHNRLLVFRRATDGSLSPAGDYQTGGAGDGVAHLPSQGSVTLTRDGRHVLVTNAASGDVSIFAADGDGLELVQTVATGRAPKSVAEHNGLVYVLNTGDPSVTGLRLGSPGEQVEPITGSTRTLADGADPAQVGFSPDGNRLVITERGTNAIVIFPVRDTGHLDEPTLQPSSGPTPYGFAFTSSGALVVTEAFGAERGKAAASSYLLRDDGVAPVSRSIGNGRSEICWAVVTHDGRYAFTTNFADGAVSRYAISPDGTLALDEAAAGLTEEGCTGLRDEDLSSDDRFLYAIDADTGGLVGWAVGERGSLEPVGRWEGLPATVAGLAVS